MGACGKAREVTALAPNNVTILSSSSLRFEAAAPSGPRYVGERIELIQAIGQGGCASVWLGRHRETGALLAAKLVRSGDAMDEVALRFQREAELSARLSHRNLVRVHDFFREPDGQPVLLMEYLRGQTLEDRLQEWGPLSTSVGVAIFVAVLRALEHAHDLGVIHRDLKPANVFLAVEPDGVVIPKLLDFGIAKTTEQQSILLTQNGQVLGSPAYMSPEQVRGLDIGASSDVFSAGTLLYEMLTGRLAFTAASAHGAMAAVLEREITPHESISVEIWPVVEQALRKDPEQRFATIRAMRLALEEAAGYSETAGAAALAMLEMKLPPVPALPPMPAAVSRPSARPPGSAALVSTRLAFDLRAPLDSTGEYSAGVSTTAAPSALPLRSVRWRYAAIAAAALCALAGSFLVTPTRAEAAAGAVRAAPRSIGRAPIKAPAAAAASTAQETIFSVAATAPPQAPKRRKLVALTPGF